MDFATLSRKCDQDILDKENRERLWSFSVRLDEVKQHVKRLREEDRGADWVFKTCRCLMEHGRGVPGPVVQRISQMVKTRTTMLTTTREASDEEAERMEAERGRKLQRPVYVEAPLGIVEGMEALYEENNLRNLLVLDVAERLRQFEDVQIDALTSKALQESGAGGSVDWIPLWIALLPLLNPAGGCSIPRTSGHSPNCSLAAKNGRPSRSSSRCSARTET